MNFSPTFRRNVLATSLLLSAAPAMAAELGALRITSGLGQPFRAELEVSDVAANDLKIRIASADQFKRNRLPYPEFLRDAVISVEKKADGKVVVRLTSPTPARSAYVSVLLDIETAGKTRSQALTGLIGGPATPPEKTTAKEEAAGPLANGKTYPVRTGDTLSGIASKVKPSGVSLEQVMVGLYETNPRAFAGNMNIVIAGKTLNVPPKNELAKTPPAEAHREVQAQVANWRAYRGRVADMASQQTGQQRAPDTTKGRIVAQTPETAAPSADAGRDVLRLSRADEKALANAQKKVQVLEEELVARDKAIDEANDRIKELEKNVSDMKALLELKNKALAEQQNRSEGKPDPAQAPATEQAAPAATKPAPVEKAATPEPEEEPIWPWAAGGAAGLAAVLGGLFYWRRRQEQKTEELAAVDEVIATAPPLPPEPVIEPESEPLPEPVAVEPEPPEMSQIVAEPLLEAVVSETETPPPAAAPSPPPGALLEFTEDFDMLAIPGQPAPPPVSAAIPPAPSPADAIPELEMEALLDDLEEVVPAPAVLTEAVPPPALTPTAEDAEIDAMMAMFAEDLSGTPVPTPAPAPEPEVIPDDEVVEPEPEAVPAPVAEPPKPEVENPILDFDFAIDDILAEPPPPPPPVKDEDSLSLTTPEEKAQQEPEELDIGDPISTKLDLARVYIEMGDSEGAREILEEVLAEGDEARKAEARALMDTL